MKKIIFLIATLIINNVSYAATPSQTLQNFFNSIQSMTANFTQVTHAANHRVQKASGTLALMKPGLFRWNITKPSTITMVSNGKIIWMYDQSLAQVNISSVSKNQGSSPAIVLSNRVQLLSNYFVVWKKTVGII